MKELMTNFETLEIFIIKASLLVSLVLFCGSYLWKHLKELVGKNYQNKDDKDK